MIKAQILYRSAIVGTLLQFTLAVLGHYLPWIRENAFLFGGMLISGTAGLLYARDAAAGYVMGAAGAAAAGGLSALIGICVSVLLGDTAAAGLVPGTGICTFTGAVGGLWGEWGARLRARLGR
ncbi:MAG TPA: hypothetical protein VG819_04220 [Rhizomicrobium sp.]|jgi:presenilin-like A22 family membrane protease|nr:hypothetical protein [Rhizomicrobium sp.]